MINPHLIVVLMPLRCFLPIYSFLGISLGVEPYPPLGGIAGKIAVASLVHLLLLKRKISFVGVQALIIALVSGGLTLFALVQSQMGVICDGIGDPTGALEAETMRFQSQVNSSFFVLNLVFFLLIGNALLSLALRQVHIPLPHRNVSTSEKIEDTSTASAIHDQ
jgi:hypothetical protein